LRKHTNSLKVKHTLHSDAINKRVVETHGDKVFAAFVAIAILFRYPDDISKTVLGSRFWDIPEATLFPEQAGVFLSEPDKGGDHLLLID